jgi:NAD(P)-dependent dehydrogenase (short-subunit alcohol dehydrogenase family)
MNVLVTGCSSGIGLLTAIGFASAGHRVMASMRTPEAAGDLHDAAAAAGVEVSVVALDVTSTESVTAAVAHTVDTLGSIDVLVNNAGVELFGAVHLVDDDEMTRQFDTNVFGVVRMCRAVVPAMIESGSGCIINVGSIAGRVGAPYSGLYAATKHAVEALTEAMHFELSHVGIRVSVIEPGQFATRLGDNALTAAAMGPDTDEFRRFEAFRDAQRSLVAGERGDAQIVAEVIIEAATTAAPRLRWLVGDDAELIAATKSQMGFEEFEAAMRATLDWHD